MKEQLLTPTIQNFILQHENADIHQLLLKHREVDGVKFSRIAEQISGRQKAKEKLPFLLKYGNILFPPGLNLEQCSSQTTAEFKRTIISQLSLPFISAVDLTGGFGIDALFLCTLFEEFHYVEPDKNLLEIAKHNHCELGVRNIRYHNQRAEEFLATEATVNFAFIDPSRRTDANKKVFRLSDCIPDIVHLQHQILKKTPMILVKAAPMLDVQQALRDLVFVKQIWVVSVSNECKELLFLIEKDATTPATVETINFSPRGTERFSFSFEDEKAIAIDCYKTQKYLYEPNASILKAGAFKTVASRYNVLKVHVNTHLYTSVDLVEDFPGRIFKIEDRIKDDPKSIKKSFPDSKANVTTRNYPLTPEQLKKKTGLRDGGSKYLIGFTDVEKKQLVSARRIK